MQQEAEENVDLFWFECLSAFSLLAQFEKRIKIFSHFFLYQQLLST